MSSETSGFEDLSSTARVSLGATGAVAIAGIAYVFRDRPAAWAILIVGIILVALLVIAWGKIGAFRQKSQAKVFSSDLSAQLRSTPQQVTGADGRAKLDDLRRKLQEGFDKLAATGKNPYVLPWYLMVGEPGSGKTKAVAAANISLPGFQDPLQGTGGTVNMNWWFTNNGIILDTAGRLMLPEVPTSNNPEWDEFLRTLNRKRPDCPINGLLLTIPADTLITDSADKIDRKAGEIAVQFNKVQGMLGIRFPVFVLITKCDKILGFREYFETVNSPDEQAQMLGWSNPDKLDEAFRPDLVEQHLQKVYEQLVRRRLKLIQDPVHSDDPAGRRLDQVDALYELPDSLVAIGPRLRRYLEPIFVAGPLSSKPLFLRGIYFTSSLQTGEAVDKAISAIMGVDIVSSHGGPVIGEKPYFLRHVFQEKVFREKGLVTRTDNVAQLKRRRKLAVMAAGFAAIAGLLGLTWLGNAQLNDRIVQPASYWDHLDKARTDQPKALAFVDKDLGSYGGSKIVNAYGANGKSATLVSVHADPAHRVAQKLQIPWIFAPVAHWTGDEDKARKIAYRKFFNSTVLKPAFDRAADLLQHEPGWNNEKEAPVLRQLLLLEARTPWDSPKYGGSVPLTPVGDYIFRGDDLAAFDGDAPTWEAAFTWLYSPSGGGAKWPDDFETDTPTPTRGAAIRSGITKFEAWLEQQKQAAAKGQQSIQSVADQLEKLDKAEQELLDTKADSRTYAQAKPTMDVWDQRFGNLTRIKRDLDNLLKEVKALGWKPTAAAPGLGDFFQKNIAELSKHQQDECDKFLSCLSDQTAPGDSTALGYAANELKASKRKAAELANNTENTRVRDLLRVYEPKYLALSPENDNESLYVLHYDLLKLGMDQLPQSDNTASTFDDVDTKLDSPADFATESIKKKVAGMEKTSKETAIGNLATAMVDVGICRRRALLLDSIMKDLPDMKDDWGTYIRSKATASPSLVIPLASKPIGVFPDPSYDPEQVVALADLWAKLKVYGDFGRKRPFATRPIMDYPDLLAEYENKLKSWNAWNQGSFQDYWAVKVPETLAIQKDLNWADFRNALKNMNVPVTNKALESLADKQALAQALKPPAAPQRVPIKLLNQIDKCRRSWSGLDTTAADARLTLLKMTADNFKLNYLIDDAALAGANPSVFDTYWISLYQAGFKALAQECGGNATDAAAKLVANYHKFPLANTKDDLRPGDVAEAQKLINQIFPPAVPPGPAILLANGKNVLPDALQSDLDLLVGTTAVAKLQTSDPKNHEWITGIQPLLNALATNDIRCTIDLDKMNNRNEQSARDIWQYVGIQLGNGPELLRMTIDGGGSEKNRSEPLPPDKMSQDVRMLMYVLADDPIGKAKPIPIGTGPWSYLRLINGANDSTDNRKVKQLDDPPPMSYRVIYNIARADEKGEKKFYPMSFTVTFKSNHLTSLPPWLFAAQP